MVAHTENAQAVFGLINEDPTLANKLGLEIDARIFNKVHKHLRAKVVFNSIKPYGYLTMVSLRRLFILTPWLKLFMSRLPSQQVLGKNPIRESIVRHLELGGDIRLTEVNKILN